MAAASRDNLAFVQEGIRDRDRLIQQAARIVAEIDYEAFNFIRAELAVQIADRLFQTLGGLLVELRDADITDIVTCYARSDQKRAGPKDSSESGRLRSRLRRYRSTRRSTTPVRWWINVTSGAGCDFGRMAASAAFLTSSNRPPSLIKHWQMLNGVAENFQFPDAERI